MLTVTLLKPNKVLHPNARATWRAKMQPCKKARTYARLVTQSVLQKKGLGPEAFHPVGYALTWFYKGVKPDADNCLAACKAYLDGIADALGINDKDLDVFGIYREHNTDCSNVITLTFFEDMTTNDLMQLKEAAAYLNSAIKAAGVNSDAHALVEAHAALEKIAMVLERNSL